MHTRARDDQQSESEHPESRRRCMHPPSPPNRVLIVVPCTEARGTAEGNRQGDASISQYFEMERLQGWEMVSSLFETNALISRRMRAQEMDAHPLCVLFSHLSFVVADESFLRRVGDGSTCCSPSERRCPSRPDRVLGSSARAGAPQGGGRAHPLTTAQSVRPSSRA